MIPLSKKFSCEQETMLGLHGTTIFQDLSKNIAHTLLNYLPNGFRILTEFSFLDKLEQGDDSTFFNNQFHVQQVFQARKTKEGVASAFFSRLFLVYSLAIYSQIRPNIRSFVAMGGDPKCSACSSLLADTFRSHIKSSIELSSKNIIFLNTTADVMVKTVFSTALRLHFVTNTKAFPRT